MIFLVHIQEREDKNTFSALMPLHVQGQVVGAGEATAAHAALERLCTGVFPEMASQLIRTGKTPLASLPGALVWLLSFSGQQEH